MTVPQPFQYQGSKRALAPLILQYLPIHIIRLVEPFCGSAALFIATVSVWFQILIVKTGLNYRRRALSFPPCARF